MKKAIIFLSAAILCSCAELYLTAGDRIKNVVIGMSEQEVIGIMGKYYDVVGANADTKTLAWGMLSDGKRVSEYRLLFVDGKLHSYHKEHLGDPHIPNP